MNSCLNKVKLCPRKVDAVTRAVPLSKFYEIHTFMVKWWAWIWALNLKDCLKL